MEGSSSLCIVRIYYCAEVNQHPNCFNCSCGYSHVERRLPSTFLRVDVGAIIKEQPCYVGLVSAYSQHQYCVAGIWNIASNENGLQQKVPICVLSGP